MLVVSSDRVVKSSGVGFVTEACRQSFDIDNMVLTAKRRGFDMSGKDDQVCYNAVELFDRFSVDGCTWWSSTTKDGFAGAIRRAAEMRYACFA